MAQLFRLSIIIIFLLGASYVAGKPFSETGKWVSPKKERARIRVEYQKKYKEDVEQALIDQKYAEEAYFAEYGHWPWEKKKKDNKSGVTR